MLDISFTEADKLADAVAATGDHMEAIADHGVWLWKIQYATMLPDERNPQEKDLREELQGRSLDHHTQKSAA